MLKPSVEVNNCYILQSKMGETLFFDLWLALAIYAPNQFLLRFIKPSILSKAEEGQLRTEALLDYRLIHGGVDTVVEADFFKDRLFISSEYQNQVLLRDFPKTKIKTDIVWIEKLVLHLAKALEFFHAHRILYGVFLPESVLVARNGNNPEDFTFLKPGYRTTLSALLKQKSAVFPYRSFIAPELLSGGTPSIAADLYSFGKLMDFLLESVALPPAFDRIVKTCAQTEPRDRFPDGSTLVKEIEILLRAAAPESFFILPSTGGPGADKQNDAPSPASTPAVLPVSQARTEVLNYFQEISANYRSEHGYTEEAVGKGLSGKPVGPPPRPAPVAPSRPKTLAPNLSGAPSVQDDYYSQWSQPAGPSAAAKATSAPAPAVPAPAVPAPAVPAPAAPGPAALSTNAVPAGTAALPTLSAAKASAGPTAGTVTTASTATLFRPAVLPSAAVPPAMTVPEKVPERAPGGASGEPVRWQYHSVSLEVVEKTLIRTFNRSKKGIGDFRFIQEPQDSESQERLNRVLKSLALEAFFIDGGSLCGAQKADVESFFFAIQGALERPLGKETLRARRRFGSLIDTAGARPFFSTGTLGTLLFGARKALEAPPVTPGKDTRDALIEGLTCFGRKKRPQVMVIRGSECIGTDLSEYLIELARKIQHKSVCVFIFGREFPAEFRRSRSETVEPTPYP